MNDLKSFASRCLNRAAAGSTGSQAVGRAQQYALVVETTGGIGSDAVCN
jgi:hypothetical protein